MSRPPAIPEPNRSAAPLEAAAREAACRALLEDLGGPSALGSGLPPEAAWGRSVDLSHLVYRDLTSRVLESLFAEGSSVPSAVQGEGRFVANESGVLAGTGPASKCFELLGGDAVGVFWSKGDGEEFGPGEALGRVEGPLAVLLAAERSALNFVSHLSGIATATRALVQAARRHGAHVEVRDTRKTTPGLRLLEKHAVEVGGGTNHRFGLYDGVLLKDNHLVALRSLPLPLEEALSRFVSRCREEAADTEVEVEADDQETALLAAAAGADVVLCDNMAPEGVAAVVEAVGDRAEVEASGRVDFRSAMDYAATGARYLAVGSITHSARAVDVSFEISEVRTR